MKNPSTTRLAGAWMVVPNTSRPTPGFVRNHLKIAEILKDEADNCSPAPSTSYSERESGQTTARKLHGSLGDLRCIASFIEETGVSI